MKNIKLIGFLILSTLPVACASTGPRREVAPRSYGPAEIERIMALREEGESLAYVGREVGGNRENVRLAERNELARRREVRRATPAGRFHEPGQIVVMANR